MPKLESLPEEPRGAEPLLVLSFRNHPTGKRAPTSFYLLHYTDPTVYYQYLYDISSIAKRNGFMTSMVSNRYINREPLPKLLTVLDVVKIGFKGFRKKFYEEVCSASLKPVLESILTIRKENIWLEIVNLVIPTLNDNPKMIDEMCRWIKENLGQDTPLHQVFPKL